MSEFTDAFSSPSADQEQAVEVPVIEVGQPLPGLVSDYTQLPDGTNYWDQVIPSPYGDLRYSTFQLRDGRLRWVTDTEEGADPTMIIVETGTGIVEGIISAEDEDKVQASRAFYEGHISDPKET